MANLSLRELLEPLTKARLLQMGRDLGVGLNPSQTNAALRNRLGQVLDTPAEELLRRFSRDELRGLAKRHDLDAASRSRDTLITQVLTLVPDGLRNPSIDLEPQTERRIIPEAGDLVRVRQRQWLTTAVTPAEPGQMTTVELVCLDDDNQGRPLSVLWELELGARVLDAQGHGLGNVETLDSHAAFSAYLHALQWSCVSATDAALFQSPFRAGIALKTYQLTPLKKALALPRVNLFIADDVGLGKTIEAGLVLQELILRQQVDWALILCPASVCLQWQQEMERRFGLRFEVMNRNFIARRRRERGFGVNPWGTHARFIISYQTFRRPEYQDPLLALLGDKRRKSLLIADEAHTIAPASSSKYAIDSRVTHAVRNLAPRFENRLFLSATPHNGHSNSFSSLLEVLDPQRFTRGVPVKDARRLDPVMVRRLKADLRALGETFPKRRVGQLDLVHQEGTWHVQTRFHGESPEPRVSLSEGAPFELTLAEKLDQYTNLIRPKKGATKLVFINLQKRLLSSTEAFYRTLLKHAAGTGRRLDEALRAQAEAAEAGAEETSSDPELFGLTDEQIDEADAEAAAKDSEGLTPEGRARQLLDELLDLSARHHLAPDAKVQALLHWLRDNLCPAIQLGGADSSQPLAWSDRRVIVFTEYGDTKRYLLQILRAAFEGTDRGDERILQFHGGMSDEARDEVQRAFNSPPDEHPVRVLVATDAAREGINLQGACADLFHYDVPWNPSRMEQRNGRIDRTLQPSDEVRCFYFFYPQRKEDRVLETLVKKVDKIQRELGSVGQVVMDRFEAALEAGIDDEAEARLDDAEELGKGRETATEELETTRVSEALKRDIDEAGRFLDRSKKVMQLETTLLKQALDEGLRLAGAEPLAELEDSDRRAYRVPELPGWEQTLDSLRPPRGRKEETWEWRKKPPQPVVFDAPQQIDSPVVHLHLQHPFVKRLLQRFLAQGYSSHDLARVTAVRSKRDSVVRVLAFGRLTLFGPDAVRLHDQVISVGAPWYESQNVGHLVPFEDKAEQKALEQFERALIEADQHAPVPAAIQSRLTSGAAADFDALWGHLEDEADAVRHDAELRLSDRGNLEAKDLKSILQEQKEAILKQLGQLDFSFEDLGKDEARQLEDDRRHMQRRLEAIDDEIASEPEDLKGRYKVLFTRVVPVGLVYLWPTTR